MNDPAARLSPELTRYFQLLQEHPVLAGNDGAPLGLILDPERIRLFEQETGQKIGVIGEDRYVIFVHDLVEGKAGKPFVYLRLLVAPHLSGRHGAIVIPVERHPDGNRIVLIRIFRHALRSWSLELPRGFGEDGLEGVANARKELFEETGLTAGTIHPLGILEPDSGLLTNPVGVFLAEVADSEHGQPRPEPEESIEEIVRMTPKALREAIARGEIQDSYTLASLTLARAKGILDD